MKATHRKTRDIGASEYLGLGVQIVDAVSLMYIEYCGREYSIMQVTVTCHAIFYCMPGYFEMKKRVY